MPLPAIRRVLAAACLTLLLAGGAGGQTAQAPAAPAVPADAPSAAPEAELSPAQTTPARPPAADAPAASLDDLVTTLENPAAREALVARLKALQANAQAPTEQSAITDALDTLSEAIELRVDAVGDAFVGVIDSIRQVPILIRWAWLQLSEPISRELKLTETQQTSPAVLARGAGHRRNRMVPHRPRHAGAAAGRSSAVPAWPHAQWYHRGRPTSPAGQIGRHPPPRREDRAGGGRQRR